MKKRIAMLLLCAVGLTGLFTTANGEAEGFTPVPLPVFCGWEGLDLAGAEPTAYRTDCEEGNLPIQLTEEDRRRALRLLAESVVTGKANSLFVTGGTTVYVLRDAEGGFLASAEFYQGLLVWTDGMYTVTEDQEELLTVTVRGVDYRLGQSAPKDFAANGWPYSVEGDGTFALYSAEHESYVYIRTRDGAADSPMTEIDLMWADGVPARYLGCWADDEASGLWELLERHYGGEPDEEGALIAEVGLDNGGVLRIETKDTRVRLLYTETDNR